MARICLLSTWALCVLLTACSASTPDARRIEGVKPMGPAEFEQINRSLAQLGEDHDQPARLLKGYMPIYPISRLWSGIEGTCTVDFTISASGRVVAPRVVGDGDEKMCAHTLYALQFWEFEPARLHGESIEFEVRMPFAYGLD